MGVLALCKNDLLATKLYAAVRKMDAKFAQIFGYSCRSLISYLEQLQALSKQLTGCLLRVPTALASTSLRKSSAFGSSTQKGNWPSSFELLEYVIAVPLKTWHTTHKRSQYGPQTLNLQAFIRFAAALSNRFCKVINTETIRNTEHSCNGTAQ
eukprot:6200653-Pleurochrysis_carterae.AAC.5